MILACAQTIGMILGIAIPEPVITEVSKNPDIAPLVLSIMAVESRFNPKAVSSANAKGLMQLTPIAVKEVKEKMPKCVPEPFDYFDEIQNIKVGTCYIRLIQQSYDNIILVLATYNGGYRQANKLQKLQKLHTETANYIPKVLYLYEQCRSKK